MALSMSQHQYIILSALNMVGGQLSMQCDRRLQTVTV
jgi:hypothetical protein